MHDLFDTILLSFLVVKNTNWYTTRYGTRSRLTTVLQFIFFVLKQCKNTYVRLIRLQFDLFSPYFSLFLIISLYFSLFRSISLSLSLSLTEHCPKTYRRNTIVTGLHPVTPYYTGRNGLV